MKHFKNLFLFPLVVFMLLVSCQEESIEITNPTEGTIIEQNSTTATLMSRTATNDGSVDNIIDYANCLEVLLPVTVTANGITITIESVTDFGVLEEILDAFLNDNDDVVITFPITVVLSDYTEVILNNQDELEEAILSCKGENEVDDDIECIDFKYPVSFSIYDTDFQVVDTKTIENDEAMYHFMESLDGPIIASLNFPVKLITSNGEIIEVNSNEELDAAISNAEDDCDEDDDYDYDDDDENDLCTETQVDEKLMNCHWVAVSYNGDNQLINYDVYFKENQQLVIKEEGVIFEGVWSTFQNADNEVVVDISQFSGANLEDFNGAWTVTKCEGGKFIFKNAANVELIIEKECDQNTAECTEAQVEEKLMNCHWIAVSYNGDNQLVNYDVYFKENQQLVITEDGVVFEGVWSTSQNPANGVDVTISQLSGVNLEDFNGTWTVTKCEEGKFIFKNAANVELILEKECDPNTTVCTEEMIKQYLVTCSWNVVNYNGSNDLLVFDFNFNVNQGIVITHDGQTTDASWSITTDINNDVLIELANVVGSGIQAINGGWKVYECAENRIKFVNDNGDYFIIERQNC